MSLDITDGPYIAYERNDGGNTFKPSIHGNVLNFTVVYEGPAITQRSDTQKDFKIVKNVPLVVAEDSGIKEEYMLGMNFVQRAVNYHFDHLG